MSSICGELLEEITGKMIFSALCERIWLGDWSGYEKLVDAQPDEIRNEMKFISFYRREEVSLWYENYFEIPGPFYFPPVCSAWDRMERRRSIPCKIEELVRAYKESGYSVPAAARGNQDHIGCICGCLSRIQQRKLEAAEEMSGKEKFDELMTLEKQLIETHLDVFAGPLEQYRRRTKLHLFFAGFIDFYLEIMNGEWRNSLER